MKQLNKIFIVAIFAIILTGCRTVCNYEERLGFFYYYNILRVSDRPLFNANGSVNYDVLEKLIEILNDSHLDPMLREEKAYWSTGLSFEGALHTVTTAAHFSDFVVQNSNYRSHSGAIIIKLFETIPYRTGVEYGHITEFTSQWWQLVYRSTNEENDVLTLWMVEPYRLTHFNGTRFDASTNRVDERYINAQGTTLKWGLIPNNTSNYIKSDMQKLMGLPACNNYFFEGNYSASILRSNLLRDLSFLLNHFDVEQFLVAPKYVPGQWQNSRYQTGSNMFGHFYRSGDFQRTTLSQYEPWQGAKEGSSNYVDGMGATSFIWSWDNYYHFSLLNGKDGLSVGPYNGHWPHTKIIPTYYDFLWIPSDFETRSMGVNKDNALFQTFIADTSNPYSKLRWNYWVRENDTRQDLADGRSGLWRLNGFDRAFTASNFDYWQSWESRLVWLRSSESFGFGNANTIYYTGNRYGYGVNQLAGMRPALHLSISRLAESSKNSNFNY